MHKVTVIQGLSLNPYILQAAHGTYRQLYGDLQESSLNRSIRLPNPTFNVINKCANHNKFVRWCRQYLSQSACGYLLALGSYAFIFMSVA